jgi:RNA polymerase sigma factor (sigma-70 family)
MSEERRHEEIVRERARIDAARRGDSDAFGELVRPYLPTLRARARRAAGFSGCDAGEIVQEALLRTYASIENYQPEYTFAQFLFGIARYAALHVARSHRRSSSGGWDDDLVAERDLLAEVDGNQIPPEFHELAGAGRFADPDARVQARHRRLAILAVLLEVGGYPHQQLSFGFSIMIWGRAKRPARRGPSVRRRADKVEVTGDPNRVVRELGSRPLGELARDFRVELAVRQSLDPASLDDAFAPLDQRLALRGHELFAGDRCGRLRSAGLDDVKIEASTLSQYFGPQPERSVAEWSRLVKDRVRRHFLAVGPPSGSLSQGFGPGALP